MMSALSYAVERCDIKKIKMLLRSGADPNLEIEGRPLNIAAKYGDIKC